VVGMCGDQGVTYPLLTDCGRALPSGVRSDGAELMEWKDVPINYEMSGHESQFSCESIHFIIFVFYSIGEITV
jgi:hypothetical protein